MPKSNTVNRDSGCRNQSKIVYAATIERLLGNGNVKKWECEKPFPVISTCRLLHIKYL